MWARSVGAGWCYPCRLSSERALDALLTRINGAAEARKRGRCHEARPHLPLPRQEEGGLNLQTVAGRGEAMWLAVPNP